MHGLTSQLGLLLAINFLPVSLSVNCRQQWLLIKYYDEQMSYYLQVPEMALGPSEQYIIIKIIIFH